MTKLLAALSVLALSSMAYADLSLANNGKALTCNDDTHAQIVINAARTSIRITLMGRNFGTEKVISKDYDGQFANFETKSGTLTFSDATDYFVFKHDGSAVFLDCI